MIAFRVQYGWIAHLIIKTTQQWEHLKATVEYYSSLDSNINTG